MFVGCLDYLWSNTGSELEAGQGDTTKTIKHTYTMECSICLEEIHENLQKTICGHFFHSLCLSKWYSSSQNSITCPLCRHEQPPIPSTQLQIPVNLIGHFNADFDGDELNIYVPSTSFNN